MIRSFFICSSAASGAISKIKSRTACPAHKSSISLNGLPVWLQRACTSSNQGGTLLGLTHQMFLFCQTVCLTLHSVFCCLGFHSPLYGFLQRIRKLRRCFLQRVCDVRGVGVSLIDCVCHQGYGCRQIRGWS